VLPSWGDVSVGADFVLLTIAGAAACGSSSHSKLARPNLGGKTTASTPSDMAECRNQLPGDSPAAFDPSGGVYAAQSLTLTERRVLRFDIVQWLTGDHANAAYRRESGDRSGAPNDYYIVIASKQLHTAMVAEDASIDVLRADGYAASLHRVSLEDLPTEEPARTFWLTFSNGRIPVICQQYWP
jgi:hypothetical protein